MTINPSTTTVAKSYLVFRRTPVSGIKFRRDLSTSDTSMQVAVMRKNEQREARVCTTTLVLEMNFQNTAYEGPVGRSLLRYQSAGLQRSNFRGRTIQRLQFVHLDRVRANNRFQINADQDEIFHDAHSSHTSPAPRTVQDSDESETLEVDTPSPTDGHDHTRSQSPSAEHWILTESSSATRAGLKSLERLYWEGKAARGAEGKKYCETDTAQDWQRQLGDLRRQAQFYQAQLQLSNETNASLQRMLTASENTNGIMKVSDEAFTKRSLVRYQNEVQLLQSKLDDKARHGQFTSQRRKYPLGPDQKELEGNMELIETSLLNLLASSDTMSCCDGVDLAEQGEDLSYLCHEAFGESQIQLPQAPFQSILRALTAVAVCKWVLETDLDEPYLASNQQGNAILAHLAALGMLLQSLATRF